MTLVAAALCLLHWLGGVAAVNENVIFSEIHYDSPVSAQYEYLEVRARMRGRRVSGH